MPRSFYRVNSTGSLFIQPITDNKSKTGLLLDPNDARGSMKGQGQPEIEAQLKANSSLTSGNFPPRHAKCFSLKRSLSVPNMREYIRPNIAFNISCDSRKCCIVVSEIQLTDLSMLLPGTISVKMHLSPTKKVCQTGDVAVSANGTARFDDLDLRYDDLSESDLDRFSLLVTLKHCSGRSCKKMATVGEALVSASELELRVGCAVRVSRLLQHRQRLRKVSHLSQIRF